MNSSFSHNELPFTEMVCNNGESIASISQKSPVMLVFLRHFGCVFCKESLFQISKLRKEIEAKGATLVFVHMTDNETAEKYFVEFKLFDVLHISDPECKYYLQFGLTKGTPSQLFGFQNWAKAFNYGIVKGYGWANQIGDALQMPGIFIIINSKVKAQYIHKYAAEEPDYLALAKCCEM